MRTVWRLPARRWPLLIAAVCLANVAVSTSLLADQLPYPNKPIKLIVPQPPGGTADGLGRIVAKHLFAALGVPVIVENKPGASSSIGMEFAARSAPDGYTMLLASSTGLVVNPLMMPSLRLDPIKELDPIGIISEGTILMVAHPDFPANDLRGVIALAKKSPGEISYATWGPASPAYVCMQMIEAATGIQMIHVAYKGGAPLVTDMVGGHIKVGFADSVSAHGPIQAGKLKVLASCAGRSESYPTAPAFKEQGVDFEFSWRNFLLVPAGTPEPIAKRLNEEFTRIQASPEFAAQLRDLGANPTATQPPMSELKGIIQRDMDTLRKIIKQADVKPE